jgi:hypothetical protein
MFIDDYLTQDIHYIFRPLSLLNSEWRWDDSKFTELPKDKFILVNCASENWGMGNFIEDLYNRLEHLNLDFLIMSHLPNDHLRKSRLIYYPYWYHYSTEFFDKTYQKNLSIDYKKYKISCLNHMPRAHRIYNYFLLKNKNYFNDCITSMYSDNGNLIKRDDDDPLPQEVLKWWSEYSSTLISSGENEFVNNIIHEAFTDTYINFLTETTVSPRLFITEKTWKPIASGQLFVVLGAPNIISHIREQGVDTFDDIIDHSYYDDEQNFEIRLKKIHEVLDSVLKLDLESINKKTNLRRLKNAENFYAGKFNTNYLKLYEYI